MDLTRVRPGDTVTCRVRGWTFEATAIARTDDGRLRIAPPPFCTYHTVRSRQVIACRSNRYNPADSQRRRSDYD